MSHRRHFAAYLIGIILLPGQLSLQILSAEGEDHEHDEHHDDQAELREEIRSLVQKIGEATRAGRSDEVRELQIEMQKLMQTQARLRGTNFPQVHGRNNSEHQEIMQRIGEIARESHELRRKGKHKEANRLNEQIKDLQNELRERMVRRPSIPEEKKIDHLRLAAENLEQAGLHDEAREMHERAERMQAELERHRREDHGEHHHAEALELFQREVYEKMEYFHKQNQALEKQIHQLHNELVRLKRELESVQNEQRQQEQRHSAKIRSLSTKDSVPERKVIERKSEKSRNKVESKKEAQEAKEASFDE